MPGYPNERHGAWAVFRTRQSVLIVPAAPCWDATLTAAVRSSQRAADVDSSVEVLGVDSVVVPAVPATVEAGGLKAGAVGTGPASWAPPRQPATMDASTKAEISALVMPQIVPWKRNSARPPG
jgi:hypothetical protein